MLWLTNSLHTLQGSPGYQWIEYINIVLVLLLDPDT